ncbi:MAG TPA: holo-ACP synthase [Clostridiales bacterium]|nr:holo-ACP synthase [Clostridiales bacterium]
MGISCGIDIIEVDRIRGAMEKRGQAFKERVFTENEIIYCEMKKASKYHSYAARFAAKEAVSKALGTGIGRGVDWKDIEVLNDDYEKPFAVLTGSANDYYNSMKAKSMSLSLSHCKNYAVAQVVIET